MQIEIWSDVVCPWCFIGKRRLEKALEAFPHKDEVTVTYRSFELDPSAPEVPFETTVESLAKKFGTDVPGARRMMAQADSIAEAEGLHFKHGDAPHARTINAHRLLHLAQSAGKQAELKEALLTAYFLRGESMGDIEVLRKVAVDTGLDPERVDQVLGSDEFLADVDADIAQARAFGASGVPFFVFDRKYGVSGAQSVDVFAQVLDQAWTER